MTTQGKYGLAAALFLFFEIGIALFIRDRLVRPFLGDVLVVVLLYCIIKAFLDLSKAAAVVSSLTLAFLVELMQFISILEILNLKDFPVINVLLGATFSWLDIGCYLTGAILIYFVDRPRII